jgi:GNAT superfamily N-acetyltransferase
MSLVLRLAGMDDLPAVLSLYAQLNLDDRLPDIMVAEATWKRILDNEMMSVHAGICDGVLVATCVLVVVPNLTRNQRPFALIENVVSDARFRGRGFGKRVVQAAIDHAWAARCYKVMLMTGRTDPAVLAFYQACGFTSDKTAFQIRRPSAEQGNAQPPR